MAARRRALLTVTVVAGLLGTAPAPADDDLYRALGGADGLVALTDAFLLQIADDRRVSDRFLESDIGRFRRLFAEHLCALTGGPCVYTGDDMPTTHGGMRIREAEFNAVVEDLIEAMETLDLDLRTQNRLLARLAPLQHDIVGK